METTKKNIFENPCAERWDDMTISGANKTCATCNEVIYDLAHFDLKTIAKEYINSGKCVAMNSDQVTFFRHLRNIQSATGFSLLLLLSQPSLLEAQTNPTPVDSTVISGQINHEYNKNISVFAIVDGERYETISSEKGEFELVIPRKCKIELSNIKELGGRTIQRKKRNFGKVQLERFRTIGTPAF